MAKEVRHILITVTPDERPVIDAQGFNEWEVSQILFFAYRAIEDEIEMPEIIWGGDGGE